MTMADPCSYSRKCCTYQQSVAISESYTISTASPNISHQSCSHKDEQTQKTNRRIRWDPSVEDSQVSANQELYAVQQLKESQKLKYEETTQLRAKRQRRQMLNGLWRFSQTFKLGTPMPREIGDLPNKVPAIQEDDEEVQLTAAEVQIRAPTSDCKQDLYGIGAQFEA
jgi:hypothetical protein